MSRRSLVIGYGSIGQRHARVLESLGHEVAIVSRRGIGDGRIVYRDLPEQHVHEFGYAVVANETACHADSIEDLARTGFRGGVLVEKPLFAEPMALPQHKFEKAGVGYNLRFHPAIKALRLAIAGRALQMAHLYVGQWLGDWRKGRDAKATYSGSRMQGGGVLRDLSHELDLVTWLFGDWKRVAALGGRLGSVTLDSDDGWSILLECERCPVVAVHLNYFDRPARRSIAVQTDGTTFCADLIVNSLDTNGSVEAFVVERDTTYRDMHLAMLAHAENVCTFDEGERIVEMVKAVELAGSRRSWISAAAA
jgi:predicted dehydrogenase